MRPITLSSLACPPVHSIFPHYPIRGRKVPEHKICLSIDCERFETFLILRIIQKDIIINVQYIGLHVKRRLFFSDLVDGFSKNTQISHLMKICPVGAELFDADRRTDGRTDRPTDVTNLKVAVHYFASNA